MYNYQLLDNIINYYDFLNKENFDEYLENFYEQDSRLKESDRYKNLEINILGSIFWIKNSSGGTYGSCWSDELYSIHGTNNKLPYLGFIEKYYIDFLNLKQYKLLEGLIKESDYKEDDYYGGREYFIIQSVNFEEFQDMLISFGIIQTEPNYTFENYCKERYKNFQDNKLKLNK